MTSDELARSVELAVLERNYAAVVTLLSLDGLPQQVRRDAARAVLAEADDALTWALKVLQEDAGSRTWEARELVRDVREDLR